MSYCRWSTDDFQCDLYVYESDRGFEVLVADLKRVYSEPLPPPIDLMPDTADAWFARRAAVKAIPHEMVPIGLPSDGLRQTCETAADCADLLERLKGEGYVFPYDLIEELRTEATCD